LTTVVCFGDFQLDTRLGELRRAGRPVKLQPQPMKVLVLLAQRAGHVVTRDELREGVWGSGTVVDFENGLNWSVRKIRETLGDDPSKPRFIETVPRRGYRFVAPIRHAAPAHAPTVPSRRPGRPAVLAAAVLTSCGLLIGAGLWQRREIARPTTVVVLPFDNLTGRTDQDFLALSATDQLITGIGSRSRLNVIDRATATKLKRTSECIMRVGELLRADLIVEGSLVGPPEAMVITAGIYRVRDNTQLWAGQIPVGVDHGLTAYREVAARVGDIAEQEATERADHSPSPGRSPTTPTPG
jgi:DNA-binding winged helix-turn-helix (wHTH) protein/TolB-like protein